MGYPDSPSFQAWTAAILDRLFFNPENLQVFENPATKQIAGYAHFVSRGKDRVLTHLVANPESDRNWAVPLLSDQTLAIGGDATHLGLAGLPPFGTHCGIAENDSVIQELTGGLLDTIFRRESWIIDLSQFRMPVNRQFLAFKRSKRVEIEEQAERDLWNASARSHLNFHCSSLLDSRPHAAPTATPETSTILPLWISEPAVPVMPLGQALTRIPELPENEPKEALTYLFAQTASHLTKMGATTLRFDLSLDHWIGKSEVLQAGALSHCFYWERPSIKPQQQ